MNNRHLNHIVTVELGVCTNKSKGQLEDFIKRELNSIEGIYLIVKDIQTSDSFLCDCENYEMQEGED